MRLSLEGFKELGVIKENLKPEMTSALLKALHEDTLKIGNLSLGIFGTIFEKATDPHATAFKKKCNLRMEGDGLQSTIEREWKDNPDLALDCVSCFVGYRTLEQIYDEHKPEEEVPTPSQPIDIDSVREFIGSMNEVQLKELGLITETITEKIVEKEVEKIVKEEVMVEVPVPTPVGSVNKDLYDAAQSIVHRAIGMYGKNYVKRFHPEVWQMRKSLKSIPKPSPIA